MEKTWINANYFHNQLVVPCERTAFYLKFAKMSLKMFRKRCAWWSLKISVGRKRIDLSPQPPSTTPGRRTAPSVISKCRSHLTEVSKSSPTPVTASPAATQHITSGAEASGFAATQKNTQRPIVWNTGDAGKAPSSTELKTTAGKLQCSMG